MLAPAHALARAETVQRLLLVGPHRGHHFPGMGQEHGTGIFRKDLGLLGRQLVGLALRVEGDVAARHLGVEPLAHIALGASGPARDFRGTQRTRAGRGPIESQFVADADHDAAIACRQVGEELLDQGAKFFLINCHNNYLHISSRATARRAGWKLPVSARVCESGISQHRFFHATSAEMKGTTRPYHASIVAFPDAALSTLTGIYDVMNSFGMLAGRAEAIPVKPPFLVVIVGVGRRPVTLGGVVSIEVRASIVEIYSVDILLVRSIVLGRPGWKTGRVPHIVQLIMVMHREV